MNSKAWLLCVTGGLKFQNHHHHHYYQQKLQTLYPTIADYRIVLKVCRRKIRKSLLEDALFKAHILSTSPQFDIAYPHLQFS